MKRKYIFYIVFFAVLVAAFYGALVYAIPGFGKPKFPAISIVQPFVFTNQDGKKVTDKDVLGKVLVVNYFFTTCRSVCPKMNAEVKRVYEHFKNSPKLLILSHTSIPEIDNPEKLKHYADSMGVANSNWIFLTGRKDSLYRQARLSYKIDDPKNNVNTVEDDFLHTQFVALVNDKGEVVKIYDGLKRSEIDQLIKDAEKLVNN